jgi:two-component system response regulator FixJ
MDGDRDPTVFVVDDDPGVLDAIQLLMRSVGLRSRTFPSAAAFLSAYEPEAPGCLVLDLRMPWMSGTELQGRLREMGARLPIIFVTAHGDIPTAVEAVKAGAVDFIQKPFSDQKLLDKVHQALALDARGREERERRERERARLASLTPREREVMALVVEGRHNKAIAQELGISLRTVESHRGRVMAKMEAASVPALVQAVMRLEAEGE